MSGEPVLGMHPDFGVVVAIGREKVRDLVLVRWGKDGEHERWVAAERLRVLTDEETAAWRKANQNGAGA